MTPVKTEGRCKACGRLLFEIVNPVAGPSILIDCRRCKTRNEIALLPRWEVAVLSKSGQVEKPQ